jgi:hypothetical protein
VIRAVTSAGNRVDASTRLANSTSVAYLERTLGPADADPPMLHPANSLPYRLPSSVAVAVASNSRPGLTTLANAYNPRRYSRSRTGTQVSVFSSLLSDAAPATASVLSGISRDPLLLALRSLYDR